MTVAFVPPKLPTPIFSSWKAWSARERTADLIDVPRDFGILGIYLLASAPKPPPHNPQLQHLGPEVVYIGMSTHVERRLERSHKAVIRYREEMKDPDLKSLYWCAWHSDLPNTAAGHRAAVQKALMFYVEAKLIAEFALKFERLPALNGGRVKLPPDL